MAFLKFSKTVMKNLFSKPVTKLYPNVPCDFQKRTRGHVRINIDDCIFCGMCGRKCPTGAINVDRNEKKWTINRFDCIQCSSCVDGCPKKCLTMGNEYTSPDIKKTKDVFSNA